MDSLPLYKSTKNSIIIIGAGNLGKQLSYYYSQFNNEASLIGYVDDTKIKGQEIINGFQVLGSLNDLKNLQFDSLVMGIGYHHLSKRMKIFHELSNYYHFENFIHPNAYVDKSAKIGKGAFISSGCVIEKDVVIGNNIFLFNSVTIAHDSIIHNGCFFAPSVTVAGYSVIGECSFAGVGATISNNISICPGTYLGAGSLVIKDITEPGWYVGQPCKKMKR